MFFTVPSLCPDPKPTTLIRSRPLNSSCTHHFSQAFTVSRSFLNIDQQNLTVEDHLSVFNNSCLNILDSIAPVRLKRPKPSFTPWMSEDLRILKRQSRKAERKWKKDKLGASLVSLKYLMAQYQHSVKVARNNYFAKLIAEQRGNPRILFKTINSVIAPPPNQPDDPSPERCEEILNYFSDKISTIRQQFCTDGRKTPDECCPTSTLTHFSEITLSTLEHTVALSKSSTCSSDCIPTWFLKSVFQTVGPDILAIINSSLTSGIFPSNFKHAIVHPLLKKPSLDPSVPSNFRPISKLPFLSKILEKTVSTQLISFMNNNQLFEKFQSGFRSLHSTETALVKVSNDLLLTSDSGHYSILILLDLSSAFDTVDHDILISRLKNLVGISDVALDWLTSYLSNRSFSVMLGDSSSSRAPLVCGVPQGSILGPLLFTIYILPLGKTIEKYDVVTDL